MNTYGFLITVSNLSLFEVPPGQSVIVCVNSEMPKAAELKQLVFHNNTSAQI